ncbi:MAG: hypothetical protein COV44_09310 [Deltaproteobacteria bacterium CG11_big_fil_rev_8_21_14_0_20_45_16]|nr:MAG: hypothetical protein COV44_09310 [Deltaproteobacteria bacterium CG11_big_fil_rev_8_21_14_0_20_45_16]
MTTKIFPLHEKALALSKNFRRLENELIAVLQEIEAQKLYLEIGFSSLFKYATTALGLSEANAYTFIVVARKAKRIPLLQKSLDEASVSVSKVKHILAVLEPENSVEWIQKAKDLSKAKIEKQVASLSPNAKKREKVQYVREEALRMHLEVNEVVYQKLKRAQEISASKNLEETLEALVEVYLKTKDPIEKARRIRKKPAAAPGSHRPGGSNEDRVGRQPPARVLTNVQVIKSKKTLPRNKNFGRKAIPAKTKHEVFLRDEGRCQYRGTNGKVCGERKFVQIHHLEPIWQGGDHAIDNLLSLCHPHHDYFHREDKKYRPSKLRHIEVLSSPG